MLRLPKLVGGHSRDQSRAGLAFVQFADCRYLELAQQPTLRSLGESAVPVAFEDAA